MFWLEAKIQAKPSSLVHWAGLQPASRRFDSFHPHDQFFMIPPPAQRRSFISSLFSVLLGNNKFKIMTAVRVGAGVVRKQEKGSFVISDSVSAIPFQHNTHAALRTMSLRHQSGEWKRELGRRREGNWKATEENRLKEGTKTKITCYRGNVWCHYSRLFISPRSSWPLPAHPSVHSQQMNRWRCYLYSQNKSCQKQDLSVQQQQQHINI